MSAINLNVCTEHIKRYKLNNTRYNTVFNSLWFNYNRLNRQNGTTSINTLHTTLLITNLM